MSHVAAAFPDYRRHFARRRMPAAGRAPWRAPAPSGSFRTASAFEPHWLLRNPHLQTLLPLLRRAPALELRDERLELPDGDFVDLAWGGATAAAAPVAILVPGMGGSRESAYVVAMAARLVALGFAILILHLRGAGPEPNRLPQSFHHGDTADLRHVCRLLRQQRPQARIAAIGWSLGGGVVLKALGEEGAFATLCAGAAVGAPLRLRDCAEHLSAGFARLYEQAMLLQIKQQLRRKLARVTLHHVIDVEAALRARDFLSWGAAYTAPVNGFADVQDYCARAACGPHLADIRRPALVLQAADDPLLGPAALPDGERWRDQVCMEIAPHGGHVGFIAAGPGGAPRFWAEERLAAFLVDALR